MTAHCLIEISLEIGSTLCGSFTTRFGILGCRKNYGFLSYNKLFNHS